eukprot:3910391-Amphidinium_carterae.1
MPSVLYREAWSPLRKSAVSMCSPDDQSSTESPAAKDAAEHGHAHKWGLNVQPPTPMLRTLPLKPPNFKKE